MKKTVNIAVIGPGHRGVYLLETLRNMDDVRIVAVCDERIDHANEVAQQCVDAGCERPFVTADYHDVLKMDSVDGVIVATSWETHIPITLDCMRAGKYVGFEVAGSSSIHEMWQLVDTYEKTGTPAMLLENCCYGETEMSLMNMVRQGLFGEVVSVECGYRHCLRDGAAKGVAEGRFRSLHNLLRNGDLYPTHGVGPMAKLLGINHGNRFLTISSTASKSCSREEWLRNNLPADNPVRDTRFNQGDVVTSLIRCAGGELLTVVHDTSLPRPYSRGGTVQGTHGIWTEDGKHIYIENVSPENDTWEPDAPYIEKYRHPLWKKFIDSGVDVGGHGGMDYFVLRAFVEAIQNGTNTPIDVYDAATWLCITTLSEESIAQGGAPVMFPDFTNGKYIYPAPNTGSDYDLNF